KPLPAGGHAYLHRPDAFTAMAVDDFARGKPLRAARIALALPAQTRVVAPPPMPAALAEAVATHQVQQQRLEEARKAQQAQAAKQEKARMAQQAATNQAQARQAKPQPAKATPLKPTEAPRVAQSKAQAQRQGATRPAASVTNVDPKNAAPQRE